MPKLHIQGKKTKAEKAARIRTEPREIFLCRKVNVFPVKKIHFIMHSGMYQTRILSMFPFVQWVKRWPDNLAVPGSNPLDAGMFYIINGVSIAHRHSLSPIQCPDMTKKLKYFLKRRKSVCTV